MQDVQRKRSRSGVVLPTVLVVMLTICLVVGMVSAFAVRSMRVTRRTLDVQRAFVVAESGLGYGAMCVRNLLDAKKIAGFRTSYSSISAPASPDPEYELRLKIVLGDGTSTHGSVDASTQYVTIFAGARHNESGVSCTLKQTILAKGTSLSDYAAFYDGDFEACPGGAGLVFKGKIHSNGDIYLTKKAEFDRNLSCVGSFRYLRKNTGLDDASDRPVYRQTFIRYGDDNVVSSDTKDGFSLKQIWDGDRYIDSSLGSEWSSETALYYGNAVQTGDDGITRLDPPISVDDDDHALIEPPLRPGDEGYNAYTESQKFANKAALYLHVYADGSYKLFDNLHGGVDITSYVPEAQLIVENAWDEDNGYWAGIHECKQYSRDWGRGKYNLEGNGSVQTDNYFLDRRTQWVMKPTDLYLDKILEPGSKTRQILDAATGGEGEIDKILYVEVDDPDPTPCVSYHWKGWSTDDVATRTWIDKQVKKEDANTVSTNAWITPIPCVRVRNGVDLKGCDLSVVTSRHLYVEGMFNTTTKGGSGGDWWNDSLSASDLPSAMLAGDTVTTLSKSWQQHQYDACFTRKDLGNMRYVWNKEAALAETDQNSIQSYLDRFMNSARSGGVWRGTANSTTYNAVFMTGIMPSLTPAETGGNRHQDNYYSGGLENIFRWIEAWGDADIGFNGSIICLYSGREPEYRWRTTASAGAIEGYAQLHKDQVYHTGPKSKSWSYARMTPPGMPNFFSISETDWARVPWSSVAWD